MKKMMFALMTMLTIAATANAMSYEQARNEALFLTDKMAYELNLSDSQYEAAYEINLDYLMSVATVDDLYGTYWQRRNLDLSYVLFSWQWDLYRAASYFFRPLYWNAGYWHFGVYARYPHRDYFYFGRPHFYASYRGGHSWRMNGGHSWYEHRRDHYRPNHITHDNHHGMRNRWDRGDYRNNNAHGSSTRVTADHHNGTPGNHRNNGNHASNGNYGNYGNHGNNGNSNTVHHGSGNTVRHNDNAVRSYPNRSTPSVNQRTTPSVNQRSTPSVNQRTTPSVNQRSTPSVNHTRSGGANTRNSGSHGTHSRSNGRR